jgi:hypothetical protein
MREASMASARSTSTAIRNSARIAKRSSALNERAMAYGYAARPQ